MASKVLSIEVGYGITKVVEMDHKAKKPKVYHCFSFPTPVNLVDDGLVQPNQMFRAVLRRECANRGIKTNRVVFTVTSSKMATREVNIPLVKENKIKDILMTNIGDYFPVDISVYQISYTILEKINTPEKKEYRLLVIATPQILIRSYRRLAQICGMELVELDYTGNSVFQIVKDNFKEGTNLVIKIEEKSTLVTVINKGVLDLQRTITYGMDDAIEVIMHSYAYGDKLKYEDAIDVLRKKTCIRAKLDADFGYVEAEDTDKNVAEARIAITESLRYMIGSILRVMDYYASVKKAEKFDRIILVGLGSDFSGLSKLLTSELNQSVVAVKQLENTNIAKELSLSDFNLGEYIANFGAVIRPLQIIGEQTTKDGKVSSEDKYKNNVMGYVVLGIGLLGTIGMLGTGVYNNYKVKQANTELVGDVNRLEPVMKEYKAYKSLKRDHKGLQQMYEYTKNPNEGLLAFIEELEDKMPSQANVLSIDANTQGVSMNIDMKTKEEAATILLELQTFESIVDVNASAITEKRDEAGNVTVSMGVTCNYRTIVNEPDLESNQEADVTEDTQGAE